MSRTARQYSSLPPGPRFARRVTDWGFECNRDLTPIDSLRLALRPLAITSHQDVTFLTDRTSASAYIFAPQEVLVNPIGIEKCKTNLRHPEEPSPPVETPHPLRRMTELTDRTSLLFPDCRKNSWIYESLQRRLCYGKRKVSYLVH